MGRFLLIVVGIFVTVGLVAQNKVDAEEMLRLVNEVRLAGTTCGDEAKVPVEQLVWDEALARAALMHANDMMRGNFFSHTGSNNSSVSQRVEKVGFSWRAVGENLAMGYESEAEAIKGWLSSPGHCANIMNPIFTRIGAAVSRDGKYWVQVFATHEDD